MTTSTDDPYNENIFYHVMQPKAFEGAVHNFKTEQRSLLAGESDTLAVREVLFLQQRVAHSVRNNGYAKAAADKFVTNLGNITVNWIDSKGNKVQKLQDYWEEFALDPCLDGHGDLGTFMMAQNYSLFETGASFERHLIRRTESKVPLKLEGIPTALHAIWYNGESFGSDTLYGIKFNDKRPISYYFIPSHLENILAGNYPSYKPIEIPAAELSHRFIRTSPGQWIGIPFLASVLIPLYELDELVDATIAKQKAAQAIAWIIENTNPISMTPTGTAVTYQTKEDNANKTKVAFKSQGGNTQYLNKGEKLQQVQSGDIGQNLPILIRSELYRICATVGVPYHSLTGDTSGLNFSSIRAIAVELRTRLEYIHHHISIPLTYRPLTNKFYALAKLYDKKLPVAMAKYQLPIWRGIDDLKDLQADVLAIQNGVGTLQGALDERHISFEEIVADRERLKEIGLDSLLYPSGQPMAQANNTEANTNSTGN